MSISFAGGPRPEANAVWGGAWPGKLCVGHHFSTALKGEGAKKRNTAEGGTKVGATNADIPRQHRGGKQGDDILERRKERGRRGGWRKLGREGRNEFLPQVRDKSSTAGLISFRWLAFIWLKGQQTLKVTLPGPVDVE